MVDDERRAASVGARRVLFLFIDGVGLGDDAPHNPFTIAALPTFERLLGGVRPLLAHAPLAEKTTSLHALDATLGVEGLPQSGTGQATLFTGEDMVAAHGRHFGPWVPTALRSALGERSILARAKNAGLRTTFANAYPEELVALTESGRRLPAFLRAGPPVAALGAGLMRRHTEELRAGRAIASEITNDGWRRKLHRDVPDITAETAGHNLAGLANEHDLTFFAHYATDTAGHTRQMAPAVAALERVDRFLAGILEALDEDVAIVIASDHGNIEDVRAQHTLNPALGLVVGARVEEVTSLMGIAPMVLELLGVPTL